MTTVRDTLAAPDCDCTPGQHEYAAAVRTMSDSWVPANGGTETPTRYRNGRTYLYVYNPALGEHRLYDTATDTVLSAAETDSVLSWSLSF